MVSSHIEVFMIILFYFIPWQIRQGETAVSARAIDETTMKILWSFLLTVPQSKPVESTSRKRKAEKPELWAGHRIRTMLHLIYVVATLCLLRHDEALHIMWTDITFDTSPTGRKRVIIRLPCRKTSQYGGTSIFHYVLLSTTCRVAKLLLL